MLVEDYWSRLWANAFLLRKPQYFLTHTYEGRLNTELKGEWNLSDSFLHPIPLHPEDRIVINTRFHAERVAAPGFVQAGFSDGWYGEERGDVNGKKMRWRWSKGQGQIVLTNPAAQPIHATLRLEVRGLLPRHMDVRLEQSVIAACELDGSHQEVVVNDFLLQPGRTTLSLVSEPNPAVNPTEPRQLGVALYVFELRTVALGN